MNDIQLQFRGYLNTPLLWEEGEIEGIKQFELTEKENLVLNRNVATNVRLGRRIEEFVSEELHQNKNIEVLLENHQIQQKKQTIGEIDCILKQNGQPVHLEIMYKFYLYDESVGDSPIEHWIGTNRTDSFFKKINKLKNKQFPILFNENMLPTLERLQISPKDISQRVLFKAQLFIPFQKKNVQFGPFNEACLQGFYIRLHELKQLKDCKFYKPTKMNNLVAIQTQVEWMNYPNFLEKIIPIIESRGAPLCWIKYPNGVLEKFFVVWWD
ncbi:DUF1853 family protein [Galbibacter mesophilus]|uniref:DUF1853 family protein n=1 Tax=Galbibacter mesophilus TaxID=379069 RepID=UPI001A914427|nr:DUF1853 family protein [Galbibacter mesophilus]MCM5663088.1 DUF1853 family protein [Galbibacter mesophilus]